MKELLLICLVLLVNRGVAQQGTNIDSLKTVLAKRTPGSSAYLQTEVDLANAFVYTNMDSAILYIDKVMDYPNANQILPEGYSHHFLVKAWTYQGRMMLKEAKTYFLKAFDTALAHDDKEAVQEIEMNLGALLVDIRDPKAEAFALGMIERADLAGSSKTEKIQWLLGNLYLARVYDFEDKLYEALQVLQTLQESPVFHQLPSYRYGVLNGVAIILGRIGDEELAINYYKKALRYPNLYDFEQKHLLLNMASAWIGYGQPDSCLYYLNKAKAIAPLTDDEYWSFSYHSSRALRKKQKMIGGKAQIDTALQIARRINNESYLLKSLVKKAEFYGDEGNWTSVKALLSEAEPYWQEVDDLEASTLAALLRLKAGISLYNPALMPDLEAYLKFNTKYTHLKTDEQLKHMVYRYQVKEKEQENEILHQELALQQQRRKISNLWLILLVVVALAVSVTALFWRRNAMLARKYNALLKDEKKQLIFEKKELQAVNQNLQRLIEQQQKNTNAASDTVEIIGREKIHFIPAIDISHLIAESEGVRYHLTNQASIWSDTALKDVVDKLPNTHFIRVYRSAVVNIRHIDWINHSSLRMKDSTEVPIGRTYKQQIKDLFENL